MRRVQHFIRSSRSIQVRRTTCVESNTSGSVAQMFLVGFELRRSEMSKPKAGALGIETVATNGALNRRNHHIGRPDAVVS